MTAPSPSSTTVVQQRRNRTDVPQIDAYQQRFVDNVDRVIATNFYRRKPALRILDAGCDTSGRQLRHLAKLTRGNVVGINISPDFPSAAARQAAGSHVSLLNMNGLDLQFPDESFDLVISANVIEHVSEPARYIQECTRVLKPAGIAYLETAPLWTSARGHHIHEDMVAENCPNERQYRNDGSVIPDWAHLTQSKDQLREVLARQLQPATCDYILWYLYESGDLNKTPWRVIEKALRESFLDIKIHTWDVANQDNRCRTPTVGEEHRVFGFAATGRQQPPRSISRRLIWRMRRWGI